MAGRARPLIRRRLRIEGVVQGVGFRPHVHRLATEAGLAGFVRNDAAGVEAEVEGDEQTVGRFVEAVVTRAPAMASISAFRELSVPPLGAAGFTIEASETGGDALVPVAPDAHVCPDCLRELRDPADRRFRYPFGSCTACGPRYTIVLGVPYDRPRTTMASFELCEACRTEYEDPGDRRFHAQPVACPACGPRLWAAGPDGRDLGLADPVAAARRLLADGKIVAVKGLGGFHLAVVAADERAVATLRLRKGRGTKPFALMARDLDAVRRLAAVCPEEEAALESTARPIVLLERRMDAAIAPSVAPGLGRVGVMLPYTPLHHLLLEDPSSALVMTSGNPSEEPIVTSNDDAVAVLGPLADMLLLHDRGIARGCDDSVVQLLRGRLRPVRRSRGFVPRPLPTSLPVREPLLALGGGLKVTLCVARPGQLVPGRHLGDIEEVRGLALLEDEARSLPGLLGVTPRVVAHDLHPDYPTTRLATRFEGVVLEAVQHHHAHMASCMAEHDLPTGETVVGIVLDGTGLGLDGTIWGGEVLVGGYRSFRRAFHLRAVPLPGGDAAVRSPFRAGLAYLLDAFGPEALELDLPLLRANPRRLLEDLARMVDRGVGAPLSSGAGRLFDAAAAIAGVPSAVTGQVGYEAQAAMELEAAVEGELRSYPWAVAGRELDLREAVRALVADRQRGLPVGVLSARLHATVAAVAVEAAARAAEEAGVRRVVLSGGCFLNRRLAESIEAGLEARGLEPLVHQKVPPGDGGLALGQAAVACVRAGG